MTAITKDNFLEASIGAFSSMLLFMALKVGGSPFTIPVQKGVAITLIWAGILYAGIYETKHKDDFFFDVFVTFIISSFLAVFLGLIELNQVLSMGVFGTIVMPGLWLGLPMAVVFDKYNIKNYFKTKYHNG